MMYTTFSADNAVHEMYTNIAYHLGSSWHSVVSWFCLRHANERLWNAMVVMSHYLSLRKEAYDDSEIVVRKAFRIREEPL